MFSHFANTVGFWALAAIPVVLLIHFLQQRARKRRVSTLFLMDALPPESSTGRVIDRIRSSRSLWLQLLAVLLCTWVLSEPKFVRDNSSQTVAIVLDDSATMKVFANEARDAAEAVVSDYQGRTRFTHWIILGTSSRNDLLYRGSEVERAREAIRNWSPGSGTHEVEGALNVAGTLTAQNGYSWFITDTRTKCPPNQAAVGVGYPIPNAGFVGAVPVLEEGMFGWKVAVKNNSKDPMTKNWHVYVDGVDLGAKKVSMTPEGINEFFVPFPGGAREMVLSLDGDAFDLDDNLPLMKPEAKKLRVSVEVKGKAGEFFRKLLTSIDGVEVVAPDKAVLRIVPFTQTSGSPVAERKEQLRAAIQEKEGDAKVNAQALFIPEILAISEASMAGKTLNRTPIVPERNEVLEGLTWNGLLTTGSVIGSPPDSAKVLLWQGNSPLAWREGDSMVLNWTWESSNAGRLPSFVLLLRRYFLEIQEKQSGIFVNNVPLNSRLKLVQTDKMEWIPVKGGKREDAAKKTEIMSRPYRAPEVPAFFVAYNGDEAVMKGAAYFDDARQGDFANCSRFFLDLPSAVKERREEQALPDPCVPLWVALIILALIGSWWPTKRKIGL